MNTARDSLTVESTQDPIADTRAAYKIAFSSHRDGNSEIYTAEADGRNVQRLTFTSFNEYPHDWSSDGNKISYMLDTGGEVDEKLLEERVFELDQEWQRENPGRTITDQQAEEMVQNALREQGVIGGAIRWFIYTADADGSNQKPIRDEPGGFDDWPVFSPSGQEVVFSFTWGGGNWDIYSIGFDGAPPRQLTFSEYADVRPDWSPDGGRIVYTSARDGNWQIYLLDMQSWQEKRLTSGVANSRQPVFSPSGKEIAYHSVSGAMGADSISELFVLDLETLDTRQITRFGKSACCANWSPDGEFIYFLMSDLGEDAWDSDIYRISPNNGSYEAVIVNPGFDGRVVVSPFLD